MWANIPSFQNPPPSTTALLQSSPPTVATVSSFFFKKIILKLKYSWFTMWCSFLVYREMIQFTHTHRHMYINIYTCIRGIPRRRGWQNPLQYSCLENPLDRGSWYAAILRVAQSPTWLKQLITQAHTCIQIYSLSDFFHYSLLQDIEYFPLCHTVGSCHLSFLCIVVCMC